MKKADGFCGWYFKCQTDTQTIALIPAVHEKAGERSGSIQFIYGSKAWQIPFPGSVCHVCRRRPSARIGKNLFTGKGIRLDLHAKGLSLTGALRFGEPSPLRFDIMGPFAAVPFLECRHRVFSMRHTVDGWLLVNGRLCLLDGGTGYIEGDEGHSFPRQYAWTQCLFPGGSLMLAAAEIPLGPLCFTGVTGAVQTHGKEYRLATYLGAGIRLPGNREIVVRQGARTLSAALLGRPLCPLRAPSAGAMTRTIHESAACRARYRLEEKGKPLLALETSRASFEYEYSPPR